MVIIDDYIEYTNKYKKIYGERTVVLIEVGSFFEIYAIKNDTQDEGASDIYAIADLCNFQVSRKNKTILEITHKNHLMAGFPSYALTKHSQTLLNNGYTVVLIEQVTPPPNPDRKLTQILSPSMQVSVNTIDGNYLMVTVWDIYKDVIGTRFFSLGIAGVDVSTGRTWVYEVMRGTSSALDEFTRCFQMYQPSEIVFIGNNLTPDERTKIEDTIGVKMDSGRSYHLLWDLNISHYEKISYQNEILQKAYSHFGILKGLEALSIENYENARLAFVYMIQFGYEHSENIIKNLIYPDHLKFEGHCTLEYNSAIQLQLISTTNNNGEKPLLSILNRCSTAFAMRRFREQLLQPLNNVSTLKERYAKIQNMIDSDNSYKIHAILKTVLDIERMIRRMIMGRFNPAEWCGFHNSLESIINAFTLYTNKSDSTIYIKEIIKEYVDTLEIDEASKYNINEIKGNIFKTGIYKEIDEIDKEYTSGMNILEKTADLFEEGAKVEYNERDGYSLLMTKKRWDTWSAANAANAAKNANIVNGKSDQYKAKLVSQTSSMVRVTSSRIQAVSDDIIKKSLYLSILVTKQYREFIATFVEKNKDKILKLVLDVSELDIICTSARNAIDYNYKCPILCSEGDSSAGEDRSVDSYLDAKNLRHPIIEIINTKYKYVPNDICLGRDNKGLLLFGMNSSGKSSFMKAIGLNIIMAQAGMFVAADNFKYKPYNHIFTRIAGIDNIYRGWSSFTIEMLELKTILQRADANSLVLGDELCSGTEAISALAIVAAGIQTLIKHESTFIFATHLHDLGKLGIIKNCEKIYIAHMHVEVNPENGLLIFDRKLRKGIGSEMYGLEVCKGLGLKSDFLKLAHEIRCEVMGISHEFVAIKQSNYNCDVRVGECKICGESNATETHHIKPQMLADANGFIEHYHKNKEFNLITVCEACHNKIHHGALEINGYKETSEGSKLDIHNIETKNRKETKNREEIGVLLNKIRYYNEHFYIRKTVRSKWNIATNAEIILFCKGKGFENITFEKLKEYFAVDINV